jgi:hypothetical protein
MNHEVLDDRTDNRSSQTNDDTKDGRKNTK